MVRIVVGGRAEQRVAAERGTQPLLVEVTRDTADAALQVAVQTHAQVVEQVTELVTAGAVESWTADAVTVGAVVEWQQPSAEAPALRVVRYRASARLRAVFSDLTALARWTGRLVALDGLEIGTVTWSLTPEHDERVVAQVRAEAARDAVRRAQAYADALDLGAVHLVALYEEGLRPGGIGPGPGPMPRMRAMAAEMLPEPTVRPDDVLVAASVTADLDTD